MRKDMGKIATDAYRHSDEWSRTKKSRKPKHRKRDFDEQPTKRSNSRGKFGTKGLGENLSPLYRWLNKQVGRKWDTVYSEMVETLQGGYENLDHIKGHVLSRVHRGRIEMIDGWPYEFDVEYRWYGAAKHALRPEDLYVNDKGILRRPPQNRKAPQRRAPKVLMLNAITVALKTREGEWYSGQLAKVPINLEKAWDVTIRNARIIHTEKAFDDVLFEYVVGSGAPSRIWREETYGSYKLYCPALLPMSKKEIKQRIPVEAR